MSSQTLEALGKLALGASQSAPSDEQMVQALELVRARTGARAALLFSGEAGGFHRFSTREDSTDYPLQALLYLQQRLVQLRVPLAFNFDEGEIRHLTRAENKQRRDYTAWLIPVTESCTEMFVLRGSWPPNAIMSLLTFVESAMPAITIMTERFVGFAHRGRLERQLDTINEASDRMQRAVEVVGSVAAAYRTLPTVSPEQLEVLRTVADSTAEMLGELRVHRRLIQSHLDLQEYTIEYTMRLEKAVEAERRHATTDALTGLLNHRGALQAMDDALANLERGSETLSILMGDVDGFKLFNDTYGHVMGDEILKLVSDTMEKVIGASGRACRYGGDEFVVILPRIAKPDAIKIGHEISERLGKSAFQIGSNEVVPVGLSMGIANFPEDTSSPSKLIAMADGAMYAAKRQRRGPELSAVATSEDSTFGVLDSLVQAVDAKDRYTKTHCDIVAEYAVKIAVKMKLPDASQRALRIAGLLHDIGKLAVPDEILKKPAPLTAAEREIMQRHVAIGEVLIREVPELTEVIQAVACHHERYDGDGYPRGLAGEAIPLIGRIIAVADAYSAMSLDRPYRKGMSDDRALAELVDAAGTQLDPVITQVLVEILLKEQLDRQRVDNRLLAA